MSAVEEMVRFYEYGKLEEAEVVCDYLVENDEEPYKALLFKGIIAAERDRHEEAIEDFRKALNLYGITINSSLGKYYLALSLFAVGRHKEGWQTLFQSRIENENFGPLCTAIRRFALTDKQLFIRQKPPAIIHVHAEGGHGDNFLLLRYLPLLVEKGYTVRFEATKDILKLVRDSFPQVEVVPQATNYPGIEGLKDFDHHLPMLDIAFVFQTDIDTIPWYGPYLKADPELVKKYESAKGKIGICWSANPAYRIQQRNSYAYHKTITFDALKPILDLGTDKFVSLQAGPARHENSQIDDLFPYDERTMTFAETAAIIENLSLVISIDTSVIHLAAAMGKPTWLMMHKHLTSFQFMCERPGAPWNTKSPWYPSVRIFRLKERGKWDSVINSIREELIRRV